ncbi:hypothetical protein [Aestuariicoccus sp. MJ-SS9]|nr:hypothetical protein [Aestuariicoccus sp. MJ-SS9]MDU8912444.1 hypothetical protein [Aestuariicoccus sp. MJ-SS9]
MKAMLLGFAAIAIIAIGAYYTLDRMGFSAADQTAGSAVRLGD